MTPVDLTGPDARWVEGRDELIVVYAFGAVAGRECHRCRIVKPASALAKKYEGTGVPRTTRHLCRACDRRCRLVAA